jgi:Zn-dependent peptidase ImmA (M78 family)
MPKVNPELLIWARESAGLSKEEACKKLGFYDLKQTTGIEKLEALESGEIEPTGKVLENMTSAYHRGLIVFFLEEPPKIAPRGSDFRNLPENYPIEDKSLVDALIRNIRVRQEILRDSLEESPDSPSDLQFIGSFTTNADKHLLLESITTTLGFNLNEFRSKTDLSKAFEYLRSKVENLGVFVLLIGDMGNHYSSLSLDAFRGFSISDDIAPFIVINDNDAKSALSFTLIHEFVHLMLGQSGISGQNYDIQIEQFCNDIAGELLFPIQDLSLVNLPNTPDIDSLVNAISKVSSKCNVSNSLISYKLLRNGQIDKETWRILNRRYAFYWANSKKDRKKQDGGPNYYVVKRYKLGANLMGAIKRFVNDGTISTTNAAKVLGVNARSVYTLISYR